MLFLLLLVAFLIPPLVNLSRYQREITRSISGSLHRPVQLSSAHLVLLPRPGFRITDFVVGEGESFGAEPILQAPEMDASVRLLSLWRGRLEISRISLTEPSLNLVRNPAGYWNFASVLTTATRTATAPTAQRTPGRSLRFPYIEASSARINFKYGAEKKPFSLLDTDIAVWLENPNEWRVRLAAHPVRTDMQFSSADTGLIEVNGSLRRASSLETMPLDLDVSWSKAPLGQISRLLSGEDYGWRADTELSGHIAGTPEALQLKLAAAASDVHRLEFEGMGSLHLAFTCQGSYRHKLRQLAGLNCRAPVGNGELSLTGDLAAPSTGSPQLTLRANRVPAAAAFLLLRHLRSSFARDAFASGVIDGSLTYQPGGAETSPVLSGSVAVHKLALGGGSLRAPLQVGDARLVAGTGSAPNTFVAVLQPLAVNMGLPTPLTVEGVLSSSGFHISLSGDAALARLLPLARSFALLPAALQALAPQGAAEVSIVLSGPWLSPVPDADAPTPSSLSRGGIVLHNALLRTPYLSHPLAITSAAGSLTSDSIIWSSVEGEYRALPFAAKLQQPLPCAPGRCIRQLDLTLPALNLSQLLATLHGGSEDIMSELLSNVGPQRAPWPLLTGFVHVEHLLAGRLPITDFTAAVRAEGDVLVLSGISGRSLSGTLGGAVNVTLRSAPGYSGGISITHGSVSDLAQLFGEDWGGGTFDFDGKGSASGWAAPDLLSSAKGTAHWDWKNGALPDVPDSPWRHFDRWLTDATLTSGVFHLDSSTLDSGGGASSVSGAVGLDRSLDLTVPLPSPAPPILLRGTLSAPQELTASPQP